MNAMTQVVTNIMEHANQGASGAADHVNSTSADNSMHAPSFAAKMGVGQAYLAGKAEQGVKQSAQKVKPAPAKVRNHSARTADTATGNVSGTIESVRVESGDLLDRALEAIPSMSTFIGTAASAEDSPPPASAPQKSFTPKSTFAPSLPESLPQPTAHALPANRKRKTPVDFTPSGPGEAPTLASPSKLGVKFEDGVAPGEGTDGEKTIVAKDTGTSVLKKDRNMIERTIWTFIMIAAFIGKSMLDGLGHI